MELIKKLIARDGRIALQKIRNDPVYFIKNIIGLPLVRFQEEFVNLIHTNKRVNITAFRSSGKSEICFVDYAIYKAFTQSGWHGLIVSDTDKQSKELIRRIKVTILGSEVLRTAVPNLRDADWNKSTIELKNGSRIESKPYSDRIRGYHVDWVGVDEAGECRDHDIFKSAITPVVTARDGDIVVVGTPTSQIDLLHMLRENKVYISKIYPAVTPTRNYWQERYPGRDINEKKKEVNDKIAFTREYMCKPLGSGDELYPYEVIEQALDYTKEFKLEPHKYDTYFMGCDFAMSGESGADFSVYVIMRKDKDGRVFVEWMERNKGMSFDEQKRRIAYLSDRYKCVKVAVDEGSFGQAFLQELEAMRVPVYGVRFQYRRNELLEKLRNMFEQNFNEIIDDKGKVKRVPRKESDKQFFINASKDHPYTATIIDRMIKELMAMAIVFKTGQKGDMTGRVFFESTIPHDDVVMGLALCTDALSGHYNYEPIVARGNSYNRMKQSDQKTQKTFFSL